MFQKTIKITILVFMLLCVLTSIYAGGLYINTEEGFKVKIPFGRTYEDRVKRVIDGDTIQLASGQRLRYIGIDTPEMRHPNKKVRKMAIIAKSFNEKLLNKKELILEYDVEKKDKYGRLLAYVFLKDGAFVNAELVRQGYALIMTVPPNVKYAELFLRLQREAREAKRGFWSDEEADFENIRKGYR